MRQGSRGHIAGAYMTEIVMGMGAAAKASRRFYLWMALACLAISVVGFMPTYFVPMAQGRFKVEPIVHIHGLILFSWMVYFCAQTWLVAESFGITWLITTS